VQPETVSTYELAADLRVNAKVLVRGNGYFTSSENQIQYTPNITSTNLYSLDTAGVEAEALVTAAPFRAFANYSRAWRLDEDIIVAEIADSANRLTWYPAHVVNAGVNYQRGSWNGTLSGHWQGKTRRRSSDVISAENTSLRGSAVDGWLSLDLGASYAPTKWLDASLQVSNVLDTRGYLLKNFDYPFDYQIQGRRIFVSLRLSL
jgi:outer membrane receptor protein involved in Fe transport